MGLGKLLTRGTQYVATDTDTGAALGTYTIIDNLAPDWPTDDYRGGMGIPGAWRAAVLLSDLLGGVPWNAYRKLVGRPVQLIDPPPPLLEQPSPPDTAMTTFSSWALDLIWHGNAIGLVAARNREGWPTAAYPVPANLVGIRRITSSSMSTLPIGSIEYGVGTMRNLGPNDVIHIKGPCEPGGLRGMGVLEAHLRTLELATEQNRQARSISAHGVPTGILTTTNPDAQPADMKAAKTEWLEAQRDRTVAALGPTTDFKPLSWNPEELQLVEARKFTLTELELIFGLPVGWLGGQTSSRTYSNIEQDAVNLLKFSLGGHLGRFEGELTRHHPRGTKVKATLDAILRSDTLTRYQAHALALAGKPWATVDEIRALEDRQPLTDAQRAELAPPAPPAPAEPTETEDPK